MMSLVSLPSIEGVIEELSVDLIANDLFAQALRDNSNLELDWLWLATKVLTDGQRAYCLRRAQRISPRSMFAQRGFALLRRRPGRPLEF
jgi:hypothetical protein